MRKNKQPNRSARRRAQREGNQNKHSLLLRSLIAGTALSVAVGVSLVAVQAAEVQDQSAHQSADFVSSVLYQSEVSSSVVESTTAAMKALEQVAPPPPPAAEIEASVEPPPVEPHEETSPPPAPARNQDRVTVTSTGLIHNVNVTFYDCKSQGFCGAMYNGRKVYEGAAACSWNLAIGTRFVIVGDPTKRVYVCEDRGLLSNTWVDIFWHDPRDGYIWQGLVGRYATIQVVSVP